MDGLWRIHDMFGRWAEAAPVVVRVVLGYVMAADGWEKVDGGAELRDGLGAFLETKSVPLAELVVWIVPYLELFGGILLIVGLATRLSAVIMAVDLALAALVVTRTNGLIGPRGGGVGYERELAYIAGFVLLVLQGPGRPSIDHLLNLERSKPAQGVSSHVEAGPGPDRYGRRPPRRLRQPPKIALRLRFGALFSDRCRCPRAMMRYASRSGGRYAS